MSSVSLASIRPFSSCWVDIQAGPLTGSTEGKTFSAFNFPSSRMPIEGFPSIFWGLGVVRCSHDVALMSATVRNRSQPLEKTWGKRKVLGGRPKGQICVK